MLASALLLVCARFLTIEHSTLVIVPFRAQTNRNCAVASVLPCPGSILLEVKFTVVYIAFSVQIMLSSSSVFMNTAWSCKLDRPARFLVLVASTALTWKQIVFLRQD